MAVYGSIVLLITLLNLQTGNGQTVKPYILCRQSVVSVDEKSAGIIGHVKSVEPVTRSCSLTLRGFAADAKVSIPGIDIIDETSSCEEVKDEVEIKVEEEDYCVRGEGSTNLVILHLRSNELKVEVVKNSAANFSINYYSNGKL